MTRSIGFCTRDRSEQNGFQLGGSGWYRLEMIAQALHRRGWEVYAGLPVAAPRAGVLGVIPVEHAGSPQEVKAEVARAPQVMVVSRYMHAGAGEQIRKARAAGQVVISDVDDHFDGLAPSNAAYRSVDPRRNPHENIEHYRDTLRASSLITVSTPFLADRYRRYGPVTVLRNAIDLDRWCGHEPGVPARLGWTGATSHRSGDLEQLQGVLGRVLGKGYADRFVHVGASDHATPAHRLLRVGPEQVEEFPQAPIEQWPNEYRHFDVGVVPLSGHPFNSAKSCIKGMEMAAAGIPFVASPSPEYRWLHAQHGIGFLAHTAKTFVRQLRSLADPAVREQVAGEWREALTKLSIDARWHEWAFVYDAVDP